MTRRNLALLGGQLAGLILLLSGLAKVGRSWEFLEAIGRLGAAPSFLAPTVAILLPWWELGAGSLLVTRLWIRPAALLSAALYASFATSTLIALLRGVSGDCGCFGPLFPLPLGLSLLTLDAVAFSFCTWLASDRRYRTPNLNRNSPH